jgi:serine/threonine protein kinase
MYRRIVADEASRVRLVRSEVESSLSLEVKDQVEPNASHSGEDESDLPSMKLRGDEGIDGLEYEPTVPLYNHGIRDTATNQSQNASADFRAGSSSRNPKLEHILSAMHDDTTHDILISHGISDLWLPIPRQTLRRLLADGRKEKAFLAAQAGVLNTNLENVISERGSMIAHASVEDDEDLVEELRVLGEGAYGIVEEVSIATGLCTIRCVRKRIGRPKQLNAQKKVFTAFTRETDVMRQVNHQHCVQFLGSYTDFDNVNILSLPIADMDLAAFLDMPMTVAGRKLLYRGMGCLCNAMNYLHQNNIRHEDLKPQNVLIHGNNILLTDFGFSLDFSDDSQSTTTARPSAWTIRYSAPEVLEFQPRNRATDIYSLGCVLLEMVSGYYGTTLSTLKNQWKSIGNGQSSFARSPEALAAWLRMRIHDIHKEWYLSKVGHLCRLISVMLSGHKADRPTSEQIVLCLSDISAFVSEGSKSLVATVCNESAACIGLSSHNRPNSRAYSIVEQHVDPHSFISYLFPSLNKNRAYRLCDMSWNDLSMDTAPSPFDNSYSLLNRPKTLKESCTEIYDQASRTGATKHFWEAHQRQGKAIISRRGQSDAWISAQLVLARHVVFKNLRVELNDSGQLRTLVVALLPICLPRSSYYGSFFWMLSWSTDNIMFMSAGEKLGYVLGMSHSNVIDLTLEC